MNIIACGVRGDFIKIIAKWLKSLYYLMLRKFCSRFVHALFTETYKLVYL